MTTSDAISTGALLTMTVIAVVLLIQYLKLQDIWQLIVSCKAPCAGRKYRKWKTRSCVRRCVRRKPTSNS